MMLIPKGREEKLQFITTAILVVVISVTAFFSVILGMNVVIDKAHVASIRYTESELLSDYFVCPGDTIIFKTTLLIDEQGFSPTQTLVTVSIWDVLNKRTVEFQENPRYAALTKPDAITYLEEHKIPNILPGLYQIRHATFMFFNRGNNVTSIPFMVSGLCDND